MEDIPAKEEVTALGGTFDHLHGGHKILLTMACWIAGKKLIVGLTGKPIRLAMPYLLRPLTCMSFDVVDEMLKSKKFAEYLEAWADRQTRLKAFLSLVAPHLEHDIVALSDVCGPTATDASITGLVVSKESIEGGKISTSESAGLQGTIWLMYCSQLTIPGRRTVYTPCAPMSSMSSPPPTTSPIPPPPRPRAHPSRICHRSSSITLLKRVS